ncbi:MAG: hypothetical protein NT004_16830 [Bacteroidetes bacterium]|nr:hypothetical protein [Bacteroidota bacterium]
MKEKDGYVDYPEQQVIIYVEKEDGNYGPIQTGSYLSANYMDDYTLKRRNLEAELREQLIKGRISIVKYYMVLEDLTIFELAARAGIRKSRVKKLLNPVYFGTVSADEIIRFSGVFNVAPANLFQVILIESKGTLESNHILENKAEHISIAQSPTANPFVVLTKIEERN